MSVASVSASLAAKISLCAVIVYNHRLARRKWRYNRSIKPAPDRAAAVCSVSELQKQRPSCQREWEQQEWVRQEASQQSQADPARTHPDQGTLGGSEHPVLVPLRQQPMVPWQATIKSSRLRVRSCPPENGFSG